VGDLGNIVSTDSADLITAVSIKDSVISLQEGNIANIMGRAIVVHELPDDFAGESGNAGARQSCGVIENCDYNCQEELINKVSIVFPGEKCGNTRCNGDDVCCDNRSCEQKCLGQPPKPEQMTCDIACISPVCVCGPCDTPNPCGKDAFCEVMDDKSDCKCPEGTTGDPFVECVVE